MLVTIARQRRVTPDVAVTFAVAAPGRLEEELRGSGASVHALGDVRLSRPASVVRARSLLRGVLAGVRPDVVIGHAPWSYAIFAPVARRAGVAPVLWQHDRADGRSLVERWAARTRADLVICNSVWTSRTAAALQPGVPYGRHPPTGDRLRMSTRCAGGSPAGSRRRPRRCRHPRREPARAVEGAPQSRARAWPGARDLALEIVDCGCRRPSARAALPRGPAAGGRRPRARGACHVSRRASRRAAGDARGRSLLSAQ